MTPIEIHNEQLAGRIIKHLERRNFNAHYCATAAEAISLVQSLMPEGSSVSWGGSQTIREMGLTHHLISSGKYKVIDRDKAETPEQTRQCYLGAMDVDYFLTSANAITQDGVIVNIDGRGNRVAAITWGPHNVIHLIGMNKVAPPWPVPATPLLPSTRRVWAATLRAASTACVTTATLRSASATTSTSPATVFRPIATLLSSSARTGAIERGASIRTTLTTASAFL